MSGRRIVALAFGLAMLWLAGAGAAAAAPAADWARSGSGPHAATPNFVTPLGPVTWVFQNAALDDGGTISGSFVYDQSTNTYSSIDVTTTNGTARVGAHYTNACIFPACNGVPHDRTQVLLLINGAADQTGQPGLALFFTGVFGGPGLGASGNPRIDISNSSLLTGAALEADCFDATCSSPAGTGRASDAGFVVAPALIPTLAEWGLILFALAMVAGGVLLVRRRRA